MYVAKKILKLNCSPRCQKLKSVIPGIRVHITLPPEALGSSESALQDSISSLTSTALHDKGGPHWRRFENEVRTVSLRRRIHRALQKNTVTLLISSGKQEGCAKTDPENPGTRRNFVISSRFLSELFFSCELSIISRQIHANWTVSASVRRGRCTHCLL